MTEKFTSKERKKEFNKIFNNKIVPFFNNYGFERHTKTSKRMFKELGNELSVFIFFDHITFGAGFYDTSIAYFDNEIGNVYDDNYLAIAKIKKPKIKGGNIEELDLSTDLWLKKIKSDIIPFIEKHSTHSAILNSDNFYFSMPREKQCKEILKRKS